MVQRFIKMIMSALPIFIIAGLLYAGLFIKPKPASAYVSRPIFERGDKFYGLSMRPSGTAWIVGLNGKIIHSGDGGKNWRVQASHINTALQDVAAWDARHVVSVGDGGVVVVTNDGGQSWRSIDTPHSDISNKLIRVVALNNGEAWAVGEGGIVLHSKDYGQSWINLGTHEDVAWNGVNFMGGRGWLVGEFGRIKVTEDGGVSWHAVASPTQTSLMAVSFKDEQNGVAVGLGGTILVSMNGGQSWTSEQPVTQEHLFDVAWDGTRWVAVGDRGVVLVSDPSGNEWRVTKASARDRGWHTKIQTHNFSYYLVGSTLTTIPHDLL